MPYKEIPVANKDSLLDLAMLNEQIEREPGSGELVAMDFIIDKPTQSLTLKFAKPTTYASLDVRSAIAMRDAMTDAINTLLAKE